MEVLDASLVHSTVEVQDEGLDLLVPLGRLVEEENHIARLIVVEFALNLIARVLSVIPDKLLAIAVDHREEDLHAAGAFRAKHVGLVLDYSILPAALLIRGSNLRVILAVKDFKFCAEEI